MMEKVKVSKELKEVLDDAIIKFTKEEILKIQSRQDKWRTRAFKKLNNLSSIEMAEILIKGYEVKETPEEELLKIYKSHEIVVCGSEPYFNKGIKTALHILGIKIKGINS